MKIFLSLIFLITTTLGISQNNGNSGGNNGGRGNTTPCEDMSPICTDSGLNFTADTGVDAADVSNPGNDYGCLFSQPNPTWYYLEISTSGDINMSLTANSDIDFIIWGPYDDLTDAISDCGSMNNIVDCSYSFTNNETPSIINASVGDVYVMLITNYANVVQDISLTQSGGSASTTCDILPIELYNFDVYNKNNINTVYWTSLSETNNDYYILERSIDNINWEVINEPKGAGNSSLKLYYSFNDNKYSNNINYYRLSQIDFDGTYEIFNIISIDNRLEYKPVLKIINYLGQEVDDSYKGLRIIIYEDGTIFKKY